MMRIPTHGAPTAPGETSLEEFLKPLAMTQTELAERIGVPINRVNEIRCSMLRDIGAIHFAVRASEYRRLR
jgi:plasmid maintenance system antidote protein VapI